MHSTAHAAHEHALIALSSDSPSVLAARLVFERIRPWAATMKQRAHDHTGQAAIPPTACA